MIIIALFDIDFHIFTVIKFLFKLVVRFNYIYFTVIKFLFNLVVRFNYILLLIPKVINVYEKRRFIFLIVDDILCKW